MRERAYRGLGCAILRRGGRGLACAALALGAVVWSPGVGLADTAPIPFSASVPGSGASHSTALEQLASRIASHIAGRSVNVRCGAESAAVATGAGGTTRLAPEICWPLQQFAEAATKPSGATAVHRTPAYWAAYDLDAVAIQTLARESVRLGRAAGGPRMDCLSMQWMPYVAEQLGATPDGAQAIARWFRGEDSRGAACRPAA